MPSKQNTYSEAYVWIWPPNAVTPVVAGKLTKVGETLVFNYGQSYLERDDKIPIYEPELPLRPGILPLPSGLSMPGCIRDGSPDAWGRRVLINKKFGSKGKNIDNLQLDELSYLLESGSDRIGALDFQLSPTEYRPRAAVNCGLEELSSSAERVENGVPLSHELDLALFHGSPIGGARPKALIEDKAHKKYIAKFSSTSDLYSVIKAEFIAMRLAKLAGLDVAPVLLEKAANKEVLLIERFDRLYSAHGWQRRNMVSALTIFGLDEMLARYASYEILAETVRHRFHNPKETLEELFKRLVFNILVGNTDDHARNHAAFWDGHMLALTPAYDICPQPRSGNEASQAMLIEGENRMSQLNTCLKAAHHFQLSRPKAISITKHLTSSIVSHWQEVCADAQLSEVDKNFFASRQFLNPYAFEGLDKDCQSIEKLQSVFNK